MSYPKVKSIKANIKDQQITEIDARIEMKEGDYQFMRLFFRPTKSYYTEGVKFKDGYYWLYDYADEGYIMNHHPNLTKLTALVQKELGE